MFGFLKKDVNGFIAHYGLKEWWLNTFTDTEQNYIDEKYQPMGLPPHTLTRGKQTSSKPSTQFLNELSTWFKNAYDSSIAERIHKKIVELGNANPINGTGYYNGRHFTTYVRGVEVLKRRKRLDEAESLLLELVKATEAEDRKDKLGVAPWYYGELAKIYRKQKNYAKEVAILERYAQQRHAPGAKPRILLERLDRAKKLLNAK